MKLTWLKPVLWGSIFFGVASSSGHVLAVTKNEAVLNTKKLSELQTAALESARVRQRERACVIQRASNLPPTFCYPSNHEVELDRECLQKSRLMNVPLAVDEFTSSVCRSAIENRIKDLEYALRPDASR